MGRQCLLTDAVREAVAGALEDGQTLADACAAASISRSTHKGYMARGKREPDGAHGAYVAAIVDAQQRAANTSGNPAGSDQGGERSLSEAALVAIVEDGARSSWRAAAWLLERRWPERWATAGSRRAPAAGQEGEASPFDVLDELAARRVDRGDGPAA